MKNQNSNWMWQPSPTIAAAAQAQAQATSQPAFVVKLTDNPGNFAGLEVEIHKVSVYSPILGWMGMVKDVSFVDVLELTNGREIQLAHCPSYIHDHFGFSKIKIAFGDHNRLVTWDKANALSGRNRQKVHCFSDTEHEVVIPLHEVDSERGSREVLLDFDVAQSVKSDSDGYKLAPRIKEVVDKSTGLRGNIGNGGHHVVFATDFKDSYSCFTDQAGQFLIRGMKSGIYSLLAYAHRNTDGQPIARLFVENIRVINGEISELCL
ncbi:MAG: DUF4382 domain-containing protein [Bacteroidetes bacterium]|nr:DUF4382 domain-containing protein [Bacteroidota bacterium]